MLGLAHKPTQLLTQAELRERLERWASVEHGSASPGEHAVAAMIADELRGLGLEVRVEEEQVHGGYWWPIGIPTALAAVAGAIGGVCAVAAGLFGAAAVADDINCKAFWFRPPRSRASTSRRRRRPSKPRRPVGP